MAPPTPLSSRVGTLRPTRSSRPVAVKASELLREARLTDAIESLGVELRNDPTDAQRRSLLFELLAFAGEHTRAEKQLDVLSQRGPDAGMGALLYKAAIHAERTRADMFRTGSTPPNPTGAAVSGTLNGNPFSSIRDADPRIGDRLEVFAAGQYMWLPFEHIASVRIAPPKRLRDTLWTPALLRTGPKFKGVELGEVLLPVLAPLSFESDDDAVRLGRVTEWVATDSGVDVPVGQKLLLVDDEEVPILEVRELTITPA
jgi:type VI secretion system protein ImpE